MPPKTMGSQPTLKSTWEVLINGRVVRTRETYWEAKEARRELRVGSAHIRRRDIDVSPS